MRSLATVSLLALFVLLGCKKDKKAPEESKPAAAAADKAAAKPGEAVADKSKVPKAAAPAAKTELKFPEGVIMVVGLQGVDQIWSLVESKTKKFNIPLPVTKDLAMMQLKSAANFKSMKWLDMTRPLLAVGWDPKAETEQNGTGIALVPITSAENLTEGMPEGTAKAGSKGSYALDVGGKKVYINVVGKYAALSPSEALFKKLKPFLETFSANWAPSGLFDVQLSITNLKKIFKTELDQGMAQIGTMKGMLTNQLAKEFKVPGMEKVIDFWVETIKIAVEEAELVGYSMDVKKNGHAEIALNLTAKKGGKIAGFSKQLSTADLSLAKHAPASAWLISASHVDPKWFAGGYVWVIDVLSGVLSLTDDEKKKVKGHLDTLVNGTSGKSWVALHADGKFPMALSSATEVNDGAKYSAAFNAYMDLVLNKVLAKVKEQLPKELKGLPTDSLANLVNAANGITSVFGLNMKAASQKAEGIETQSIELSVDVEKLKATGQLKEFQPVLGVTGNRVEFAASVGAKTIAVAMGPNAVKTAGGIVAGKASGNNSLLANQPRGTGLVFHIDVKKAFSAWEPVIKLAEPKATFGSNIPDNTFVSFAMAGNENTLTQRMVLSLDELITLGMNWSMSDDSSAMPKPASPVPVQPEAKDGKAGKDKSAAAPAEKPSTKGALAPKAPVKKAAEPRKDPAPTGR